MSKVHEMAQKGFGQGTNELYDKARPTFPHNSLDGLYAALPKRTSPLNILELGAGTGLFTRSLLSHPAFGASTGSLLATDPSAGMRSVFAQRLASDARVKCEEGTFDSIPAEEGWADLVVAAQAWHWCPDHDKALTEIRRVLKPDGVFACIWNLEDRDGAAWVAQLRDTYEPYEGGSPQFRLGLWRATFTCVTYPKLFLPPEESEYAHVVPTTAAGVVDRVFSKSYIAILPQGEKAKVRERIEALLQRAEGRVWIDEGRGVFEWPYKTFLIVMKLK